MSAASAGDHVPYIQRIFLKKKLTQWEAELKDEKKEDNSGTSMPFLKPGLAISVKIYLWVIFFLII